MIPRQLHVDDIDYWAIERGYVSAGPMRFTSATDPDVAAVTALVTPDINDPTVHIVRVPWKPTDEEIIQLFNGGTLWMSSWGGLLPHMIEVVPKGDDEQLPTVAEEPS